LPNPYQDAPAKTDSTPVISGRSPDDLLYYDGPRPVNEMTTSKNGARITTSTGVTGTLGCLAHTLHDAKPVLLSTWHVLFGNGAREGDAVWLVNESDGERTYAPLGRSLYGKLGLVRVDGEEHYIDCAVSSFFAEPDAALASPIGTDIPRIGDRVTKTGAATGTTIGIIIDVNYTERAIGQILIKPVDDLAFAAEGDSGSLIVADSNKAVGLLWGTNTRGEGVACPIAPVLYAMNITLAQTQR
jgi:hypothetical protein